MLIDLQTAIKLAEKDIKNPLIQAIILGPSGAGKSRLLGSMGVKTLLLYGTGEDHGPKSARASEGSDIIPVCIDYGLPKDEKEERYYTPEESFGLIKDILRDYDLLKSLKIKAIAIDGLAVMESMAKKTRQWADKCKTAAGKHNTFKESEATLDVLSEVIDDLKMAQKMLDLHIAVTCMLDVKGLAVDGAITEAAPRLTGYMVAEPLLQQFGDVLVVGKMTKANVTKYKLQFLTDLAKSAKDEVGELKRAMNFSPRLSGVGTLPPIMDASLADVAKYKVENIK